MKTLLPAIVFACLVVAATVVHGMRTQRWNHTGGFDEAVQRLDAVPLEFGDWRGKKLTLDDEGFARFGIKGYLFSQYRHARTGTTFSVLLVCGRAGPISVHTPDVCYEGAGFEAIGSPELREIHLADGISQKCWSLRFRKPGAVSAAQLEILWAWNGGDGWAAPENPRFVFARHPVLYKLYVIRDVSPRDQSNTVDPFKDFLNDFLPAVNRAIAPN